MTSNWIVGRSLTWESFHLLGTSLSAVKRFETDCQKFNSSAIMHSSKISDEVMHFLNHESFKKLQNSLKNKRQSNLNYSALLLGARSAGFWLSGPRFRFRSGPRAAVAVERPPGGTWHPCSASAGRGGRGSTLVASSRRCGIRAETKT